MHDGTRSHYQHVEEDGLTFSEAEWLWYKPKASSQTWSIKWVNVHGDEQASHWKWACHWCRKELPGSVGCSGETCQAMDELTSSEYG